MGNRSHAKPTRRRGAPALLAGAGIILLGIAVALVVHVVGFYAHSNAVGGALLTKEKAAVAEERTATTEHATARTTSGAGRSHPVVTVSCPAPHPASGEPAALLEIPAIGLDAPVLQGDSDGVLAVAVGHNPASSWQAGPGTVVLDAHDVTWFHHLPRLRPGETISVIDPCETVRYRVDYARVEPAGTPVGNRPGYLVLVTCYPLDALFYTNQRYVVGATQVGVIRVGSSGAQLSGAQYNVSVPGSGVPATWAGVSTLANNPTPLGALHVNGHPSASWSESPAPLNAAAAVQDAFFASLREAATSTATWSALHPGLPPTQAVTGLAGTRVVGNIAAMQTWLVVDGSTVRSGTVTDGVELSDGAELDLTGTFEVSGARPGAAGSFRLVTWTVG